MLTPIEIQTPRITSYLRTENGAVSVTCSKDLVDCRDSTKEGISFFVYLDPSDADANGKTFLLVERPPVLRGAGLDYEPLEAAILKELGESRITHKAPFKYRISGVAGKRTLRVPYDYTDPQGHVLHLEATYEMPTWKEKPKENPYSLPK
jgi:hypothetical protein